jgi:PAS domain S-box-containing protein
MMKPDSEIKAYGYLERLKRPALWLVVLVLALTVLFWMLDITAAFEPPYLTFSLNTMFIFAPSLLIALISLRGFARTGNWPILWLGVGTFTFGIGTILGGLFVTTTTGNIAVTVSNIIFFFGASLHFLGAFFVLSGIPVHQNASGRLHTIMRVYFGVIAAVIFVSVVGILELLPPFFVAGSGGTPIRQLVLGTSAILFLLSGLVFLGQHLRTKSPLLYWYSLGLLLLSLAMVGILIQTHLGSPLNWMGRGAQYISGLYLLAAALVTVREARIKHIPTGEAMADLFTRIESKMKESEYRAIVENAQEGIVVTNPEGTYVFANQKMAEMLRYPIDEILNKSSSDFMFSEDPRALEARKDLAKTGSEHGEFKFRRKDGSILWTAYNTSPLFDSQGEHIGNLALHADITERKKMEEALLLSKLQLDTAFRNSPVVAWGQDMDLRYTWIYNPALTFSPEGVLGKKDDELVSPEDAANMTALKHQVLDGGIGTRIVIPVTLEGNQFFYDTTVEVTRDSTGGINGIVCTSVDITDLKKAEMLKDDFIGMVSHELRTPLTVFLGAVKVAMTEGITNEEIQELLRDASHSADSLAHLLDNLLELSLYQANRLTINRSRLDIAHVIRNAVQKSHLNSHKLSLDIAENFPLVEADQSKLEQVILNLLDNAAKYSPVGTEIHVLVKQDSDQLAIGVRDQGKGIPADEQGKLFQSFERLHENSVTKPGLGLGLLVCKRLVEAQGGRIWVESEPGKGSTFWFTLPLNYAAS